MDKLNKGGLVQFVKMITDKGWINTNTGNALKASVSRILGDVAADQDVRQIDVDMEIRRYNNLHPGDLSPESLATYGKRVKIAISNYVEYVANPTKYKPPGSGRSPLASASQKKAPAKTKRLDSLPDVTDVTDVRVIEPIPSSGSVRTETFLATEANLAMPFPLRPGYLAQIVIPRDMTKAEAGRLCAFIQTLATVE
jgi:hypothetical protein